MTVQTLAVSCSKSGSKGTTQHCIILYEDYGDVAVSCSDGCERMIDTI